MQDKKPQRLPRVEREDDLKVHEDENQHLWAVSYSDFLMALLSFFILFFSVDAPQKQNLILQLASEFSKDSKPGGVTGGVPDNARLPASLTEAFKDLNIAVDKEKESLVVNFPEDFFGPGKHQMTHEKKILVEHLLKNLKPYQDKVNLFFEGHADNAPLTVHRNEIVKDNFILSSLRASAALSVAKEMGYSEKNMFIQAASSNLRNSRSLSIRIEPRGGVL